MEGQANAIEKVVTEMRAEQRSLAEALNNVASILSDINSKKKKSKNKKNKKESKKRKREKSKVRGYRIERFRAFF